MGTEAIEQSKSFLDKTLFDGKLTVKQLLIFIIVVIAILLVLKFFKGIIKLIFAAGLAIYFMLHFGLISPAQLGDISKTIAKEGIAYYQQLAGESDNIRVVTDKKSQEKRIEVKLGETWVDLEDIDSITSGKKAIKVNIGGQTYTVNDPKVMEMLKSFTDGNFIQKIFNIFE